MNCEDLLTFTVPESTILLENALSCSIEVRAAESLIVAGVKQELELVVGETAHWGAPARPRVSPAVLELVEHVATLDTSADTRH